MPWLLIAFLANLILGSADLFDKVLLKRAVPNPVTYTFWLGATGVASLALTPFGFRFVSLETFGLSFLAGTVFLLALYFLFTGLSRTEASAIFPGVGTLSSLATLLIGFFVLGGRLSALEGIGFSFLVLAGAFLFFGELKAGWHGALIDLFLAAAFFGLSNVLAKSVFLETNFISGFIWMKLGGVAAALLSLSIPAVRYQVRRVTHAITKKSKIFYLANRGWAALGSILLFFAISLAHPALVDATQGVRYLVIFFGGWLFLRERFFGRVLWGKILATIFIGLGLATLALKDFTPPLRDPNRPISWGVTFSEKFSRDLGLEPNETLRAILTDLNAKNLRLIAYWDQLEPKPNEWQFERLDWQLEEARRAKAGVILAVGYKLPRWPECHQPEWASALPKDRHTAELREYIREVVTRYRSHPAIKIWQVENEPFLMFGECGTIDAEEVDAEIALMKSLDPTRPVLVTDSGEIGRWYKAAKRGDIFGTTLYRQVYNHMTGEFTYPLGPGFFRAKERLVRAIIGEKEKPFIVSELQAEPWGSKLLPALPVEEQLRLLPIERLREYMRYAKDAGFDTYYLWGAEWWYWMKTKAGHPEYWEFVKSELFK